LIVAPSMIGAPSMTSIDRALPIVSDLHADGTMSLFVGGVTATVAGGGPWGSVTSASRTSARRCRRRRDRVGGFPRDFGEEQTPRNLCAARVSVAA